MATRPPQQLLLPERRVADSPRVADDSGLAPTRPRRSPDRPSEPVGIVFVRNPRARNYVLRVRRDGSVRVTIPRGGSEAYAHRFAAEKTGWIRRQLARLDALHQTPPVWGPGTEVWYRGQRHTLETIHGLGRLADQTIVPPRTPETDWRPSVERHLRELATRELPPLVQAAADRFGLGVRRIVVRNQRSRWGSCSRRGTVSLNWRLVQTPPLVRDYLIAHELAHLREMNHSRRFWRVVEHFFPAWREAELWLRRHGRDLLG